jgi:PleD family two-component response regulator
MDGYDLTAVQAGCESEPGDRVDATPRVLVVEDDPFIARGLHRLLVSRGVRQVVLATTVAEALELLEPPPDWVILDIHLGDESRLAVAPRRHHPQAYQPGLVADRAGEGLVTPGRRG